MAQATHYTRLAAERGEVAAMYNMFSALQRKLNELAEENDNEDDVVEEAADEEGDEEALAPPPPAAQNTLAQDQPQPQAAHPLPQPPLQAPALSPPNQAEELIRESHLWLQRAADNFDVDAQADLGEALLTGTQGFSKNTGLGLHYLRLAGRQGDHRAQSLVGRHLLASDGSTSWTRPSSESGTEPSLDQDPPVATSGSNSNNIGSSTMDNLREAVRWLHLAACENPRTLVAGEHVTKSTRGTPPEVPLPSELLVFFNSSWARRLIGFFCYRAQRCSTPLPNDHPLRSRASSRLPHYGRLGRCQRSLSCGGTNPDAHGG
jgi:hypothetical protein